MYLRTSYVTKTKKIIKWLFFSNIIYSILQYTYYKGQIISNILETISIAYFTFI